MGEEIDITGTVSGGGELGYQDIKKEVTNNNIASVVFTKFAAGNPAHISIRIKGISVGKTTLKIELPNSVTASCDITVMPAKTETSDSSSSFRFVFDFDHMKLDDLSGTMTFSIQVFMNGIFLLDIPVTLHLR